MTAYGTEDAALRRVEQTAKATHTHLTIEGEIDCHVADCDVYRIQQAAREVTGQPAEAATAMWTKLPRNTRGHSPDRNTRTMTTKLEAVPPDAGRGLSFDNLVSDKPETVTTVKRERQAKEPQLRALRRILGDAVMDIFPQGLMDSVDKAHEFWKTHGDDFLVTDFDSEQDKDDSLTVMRAYAECAKEAGYSIFTRTDDNPLRLVWKVAQRRVIGGKDN